MRTQLPGNIFSLILIAIRISYFSAVHAQAPVIEWQKSLGGTGGEVAECIQQTKDGGFIVAGGTDSQDGDVSGNHGGDDYWIVKLDTAGYITWQKSLGGSGNDFITSIEQTADRGFIIAGSSQSNNGDVSGNHGLIDYWIVKIDSGGNMIWQKSLGGSGNDIANSIQQTTDGGFVVAGNSDSQDGDVSGNHGLEDYWIVKLDSIGNLTWQKSFGGSQIDNAQSIQQTTDNGFIIAGTSVSQDGDISGNLGYYDYWIVKLDSTGNLTWQKSFGGTAYDTPNSIQQTSDNGFIIAGFSTSNDGDVSGNHGYYSTYDDWIVKLDSDGNIAWQKCLGGSDNDWASSVQQTTDDGFIVAGGSTSNDDDVSGNHNGVDEWIVKLDTTGNIVWQKCLGGMGDDEAFCVQQTSDSRLIVAGSSKSNDGDVSGHHGPLIYPDCWVVKLSFDISTGIAPLSNNFISLYPNPVQTQLTINLATPANQVSIRVYDVQGRIIALPITFTNTQAQLNTTTLPDGFYTLQITNYKTGESEVAKFVKGE